MSPLTLTRDEASAICDELAWTCSDSSEHIGWDMRDALDAKSPAHLQDTLDALEDCAYRLRLEARIRDGAGWWDHECAPNYLDLGARFGDAECPESFELTDDAAAALRELCWGWMHGFIADVDDGLALSLGRREDRGDREDLERRKAALLSLCARFDINVARLVAA